MKKLCVDNIVIIELYPSYFYVKDLDNGKVLFNGGAEYGLYKIPQGATTLVDSMISSSCCHVSINIVKCHKKLMVNEELWHNRLGHVITSFKHFDAFVARQFNANVKRW